MLVNTLKIAAGAISFVPGETLDLPETLVSDLIKAGAVKPVEAIEPAKKGKKAKSDGTNSNS
jgi:hypothetical protein